MVLNKKITAVTTGCVITLLAITYALSQEPTKWQQNETSDTHFESDSHVVVRAQHLDEDLRVFAVKTQPVEMTQRQELVNLPEQNDFPVPDPPAVPKTPYDPVIVESSVEPDSVNTISKPFTPPDNQFLGANQGIADYTPGDEDNPLIDLIWWTSKIDQPLAAGKQVETTTVDELLHLSLFASPKIAAISKDPLIREAQIIEADAEFDPVLFTRNLFEDRTDPVGNTLTTGGAEFLEDHIFSSDTGVRRKLRKGGTLEASQNLGFQNSNSQFFVPQDQGTATLAINLSQPLLRGGGAYFNRLQILIAQSAGEVAWEVFSSELQDELQRVLSSYWQLYFDRSNYLQIQRNVLRGQKILNTLEERAGLDSLPSQIARARSAVEARKTDLANALRDIRNAETNIRRLVGDDDWSVKQLVEILPIERPTAHQLEVPLQQVVQVALENRPEIRESAQRAKIAAYQMDISTNEILPELTWLMGTYFSGLEGDSGIERAWVEQFSTTTPGYSMGLEFEVPYRNRAAQSRLSQSRIQLSKLQSEFKETVQRVVAESQVAYRRVESALQTLKASYVSIEAANQDLRQQQQRFETFALIEGDLADGQTPTTVLDQLLDAQERLTVAESVYSQAILELQVSSIALNRATGTLLMHRRVSYERIQDCNQPTIRLYQAEQPGFDQPATVYPKLN